jgi:hypothetical protein
MVCFESHLNTEWFRIARTIREMGNHIHPSSSIGPSQTHSGMMGQNSDPFFGLSEPLWKFLDFIAMHRSPLYTLLLPFIHTRARMPADNDQERNFQLCTKVSYKFRYSVINSEISLHLYFWVSSNFCILFFRNE